MRGQLFNAEAMAEFAKTSHPLHFTRVIAPMLRERGVTDGQIDTMLIDNPRRYFAGDAIPRA